MTTETIRQVPSDAPRTLHRADLSRDEYDPSGEGREAVTDLDEATVISSIQAGVETGSDAHHYPVLDIDLPAALVRSSTPGHFHLYLDISVSDEAYWKLCDALAEAGILQPGYVAASKARGYTSVRLPWIKKGDATSGGAA